MISDKKKAKAIALIKMGTPLEDIAFDQEIPLMLLKEWQRNFDVKDLTSIEANVTAVATIMAMEDVNDNEAKLRSKLEEAAIEIADRAKNAAGSGDVMYAKGVELCAKAVGSLYTILVLKGGTGTLKAGDIGQPSAAGLSLFQREMRD